MTIISSLMNRYGEFQTAVTQQMRKSATKSCGKMKSFACTVLGKIENFRKPDKNSPSNQERPSTFIPVNLPKVEKKLTEELLDLIPPAPCEEFSNEEIEEGICTDPFFSDEEGSDEEEIEMQHIAYEVDHLMQYTQLLHQVEVNKGKIIKTKGSDILIQKPHPIFSSSGEIVKGSSSEAFQKLLNEARRRMEKEPLVTLQLLRTMSFNPWVKKCLHHHAELKEQFEQIQHRALQLTLEESLYYFTNLIKGVNRQEIQAKLEIGDEEDVDAILKQKCPRFSAYTQMFATFKNVIVDKILSQSKAKQRRDVIATFIYVANQAFKVKDYTTAVMIISGLNAQTVNNFRLKETWQMLPKSAMKMFKELEIALDMRSGTYAQNVQEMLELGKHVCIPYLVPFQTILNGNHSKLKQTRSYVEKLELQQRFVERLFSMKKEGCLVIHLLGLQRQLRNCKKGETEKMQKLSDQLCLVEKIEQARVIEELTVWKDLQAELNQYRLAAINLENLYKKSFDNLLLVAERARNNFNQLFSSHDPSKERVFWFNQPLTFLDEEEAYQKSLEIEPLKTKQQSN